MSIHQIAILNKNLICFRKVIIAFFKKKKKAEYYNIRHPTLEEEHFNLVSLLLNSLSDWAHIFLRYWMSIKISTMRG